MVKTPARMSSCVASSTPLNQPASAGKRTGGKTAVSSATKTPGALLASQKLIERHAGYIKMVSFH